MVWVNKFTITQELASDANPLEWSDIEGKLLNCERVNTAYLYTNEEQTEYKPSDSYVFVGSFTSKTNDNQILGALNWAMEENIPKDKVKHVRVFPEITNSQGEKHLYARFLVEE